MMSTMNVNEVFTLMIRPKVLLTVLHLVAAFCTYVYTSAQKGLDPLQLVLVFLPSTTANILHVHSLWSLPIHMVHYYIIVPWWSVCAYLSSVHVSWWLGIACWAPPAQVSHSEPFHETASSCTTCSWQLWRTQWLPKQAPQKWLTLSFQKSHQHSWDYQRLQS